jgi:N-acetylglucosamine-6-sulfatase
MMTNRVTRRAFLGAGALTLATLALDARPTTRVADRPNFLLIVSDDARYDTLDFMPRTRARVFDEGITFTNAFCTTPLCGPSRATILTGTYAHNHCVYGNNYPFERAHCIHDLQSAGYYTGLVGKGLNSWGDAPRTEFDFWAVPRSPAYFDPEVNFNGIVIQHRGYATHILRDYAFQFLDRARQRGEPFILLFWPFAPHSPADPAPGDEDLYTEVPPHRPPNHNEEDVSDKPLWLWVKPLLTEEEIEAVDALRLRQLRCLNSLDEAIESLVLALESDGSLDSTVTIYLSDNGLLWGEHRLTGKRHAYQPSARTPLGLRYPALVRWPRVETRLVGNLDIAPTIYQLAGLPIPGATNGRTLVPLMEGTGTWRTDLLIESWPNVSAPYAAVVELSYLYVETEGDLSELYDLELDPSQLQNQIRNPHYSGVIARLAARLQELRRE